MLKTSIRDSVRRLLVGMIKGKNGFHACGQSGLTPRQASALGEKSAAVINVFVYYTVKHLEPSLAGLPTVLRSHYTQVFSPPVFLLAATIG